MHKIQFSISDEAKRFIEAQVAARGDSGPDEYLLHLIRSAQERSTLEEMLVSRIDAIEAGDSQEMADDDWRHIRSEVARRSAAKGS